MLVPDFEHYCWSTLYFDYTCHSDSGATSPRTSAQGEISHTGFLNLPINWQLSVILVGTGSEKCSSSKESSVQGMQGMGCIRGVLRWESPLLVW